MSQTIYARVPDHVKQAADAYAAGRGMTLASAVTDLLDRGLQAAADETSIADLERRVAAITAENDLLRQRQLARDSAYQALSQRIAQPVGICPDCESAITGYDLLVVGRCPVEGCAASLASLLGTRETSRQANGMLDDGEFKILLGALGVALGIAFVSQQGGGG